MFKFLNLQLTFYTNLKKLFTYLLIVFIFVFAGCQESVSIISGPSSIPVDSTYIGESNASQLIAPYKEQLDKEMNEVLVVSDDEFKRLKGQPETKLGNLVADLSYEIGSSLYNTTDGHGIDFCLLNFGGLRTSLPKGEITRGKIFELMPFENELVVITIHKDSLTAITDYLVNSGGQPISGKYRLEISKKEGKENTFSISVDTELNQDFDNTNERPEIKILTTDYLANGGDKMNFFTNPIRQERVGIKLRDAIIQYCQALHKEGKKLTSKLDGRISFE